MPRLVADRLAKRFGRRVLFRRLTFALEGGRSLAITGANGSGKSTLLRILAGVLRPSKGAATLHLDGAPVAAEERPLHTGLVAPYLNVYDGFSARENLAFLAQARRLPRPKDRIADVLALVELTDRADDRVGTFSSGMQQRVKYAAALLATPPLLLLDEPTTNLDAAGLAMVERVIEHQRATGGLLVVATNAPAEADRCDAILRLEDFR
ncbi:MAG: ATP-binding cassette domain-containing protein [Rhodothermales bacterium]|nr:ATP-binding cassette domain-containing protein [Rhodothermales bacterium]